MSNTDSARATARALIAEKLQLLDIWQDDHAELFADEIIAALESDDLTIAPTEPGRVVISEFRRGEVYVLLSDDSVVFGVHSDVDEYVGHQVWFKGDELRQIRSIITAAERPADDEWPVSMASIRQAIRWTGCVDIAKYPWDEEDERAAAEFLSALAAAERPDEMVVIRRADAELLSQPNPEQDGIYTAMAKDRVHQALAASSAEPDAACGQGEETE